MPVEQRVILLREVKERGGDRERNHDRVDALGADRNRTDDRRGDGRQQHGKRHQHPPRPAKAVNVDVVGAEDRHRVGGDAGAGDLRQADHAAVAGKQHHRQRQQAPDQRISADLGEEELRGDERIEQQRRRKHALRNAELRGDDDGLVRLIERQNRGDGRPRLADNPLRPQRQRHDHNNEGQNDAVGRQINQADLLGQADQQCADGGAGDRAHAADNDDDQRREQVAHVLARCHRQRGAADHAGKAGEPAPTANTMAKTMCTLTPEADSIARSSTPARIIVPMRVRLIISHKPTPMTMATASTTKR